MKRVLLVTHDFPPHPSPGALRSGYLAQYLPEFGWDATVVTRAAGDPPFPARIVPAGTTASTPLQGPTVPSARSKVRRALGRVRDMLIFPDYYASWIPRAVRAGMRASRERRFDAIFSTALPMSAHVAAWSISRITGVPWLADYRDAWSDNPYMEWGPVKRRLERALEQHIIKRASQVTTVSDAIAAQLSSTHRRQVVAIPNGYDPALWRDASPAPPAGFNLVYAGNLYDGKRSPQVLFQALRELSDAGHPAGNAVVHFYSANNTGLLQMAQQYGVDSQIRIHGMVPHAEVLQHQRDAAVLLILLNTDPKTEKETGSKYLEYLSARRPVLVCGPPTSVMRGIVQKCRLGWFAANVSDAKQALSSAYARFTAGDFVWTPDTSGLPTARDLARAFAECLDRVCEKRSARGTAPLHPVLEDVQIP
jgi:glycosyltransferase involved in cell wall biosynthesis